MHHPYPNPKPHLALTLPCHPHPDSNPKVREREELRELYRVECKKRKKLYNELQDLQGNLRPNPNPTNPNPTTSQP